jgi:hypothetical protein
VSSPNGRTDGRTEEARRTPVDDPGFALAIGGWIVVAVIVRSVVDPSVRGPALFAGFALILIVSVLRAALTSTRTRPERSVIPWRSS